MKSMGTHMQLAANSGYFPVSLMSRVWYGTGRTMTVALRADLNVSIYLCVSDVMSALACLYQMESCRMRVAANAMSAVIIAVMMLLGGAMAAEVAQSPSPTAQTGAAAAAIFAPCMAAAIVASLIAFLFF
eukprot:Gb_28211 [translate_table: standard]